MHKRPNFESVMTRSRQIFGALAALGLLMHFMVQVAPLWMPKADGLTIQICGAWGVKTITMNENGEEIPTPQTPKSKCTFCTVANTAVSTPADLFAPVPATESKNIRHNNAPEFTRSYHQYAANLTRGPPSVS